MAIAVKATAVSDGTTADVIVPASTSPGDLILIFTGSYNSQPYIPSGYTQIIYNGVTATYTNTAAVGYRIAQAGDAGTTVTLSGGQTTHEATVCVVVTGHDSVTPIHQSSTGLAATGTVVTTSSMTTTKRVRRFNFYSEMSNAGGSPVFSANSSGQTLVNSKSGASNYYVASVFSQDAEENAGTLAAASGGTSQPGSLLGFGIAVAVANAVPTITSTSPTTFADNRTAPVRISWTYSDTESNTQYKYEVGYRVQGTSTWTTVTNTTANAYYDIPTATLTLGNTYEYQVRIDDNQGGGWSSYATGSFVAGTSAWTNGSQVSSSTQSTTIDTTGLAPGTYYVQVRTADAVDFGPWSANQTFVVTPLGNVWVRTGGTWVQMKNNVKVAGTFKQVPPTKKNTGGTFN